MGAMNDSSGGGERRKAAEDLILRTIAAHADSLLRTARRHSICLDDAQDAYQRAIELFMSHAQRLDAARAPAWLHVVVKREAQAIQRARRKILMSSEVDLDGHEAEHLPTPEEQLLRLDVISRSAEALKRLKPQELRAMWLRGQGHSYSDISAITGWSYTKVNRCLSEGRRHFLEQYEGIESGEECKRWLPVLSAMVDGEASAEQVLELRPHLRNCPGCRATLRALRDSRTPLAALLPVPLVVGDAGFGDQVVQFATRLYEAVSGGLHERAVSSFTKAQAVVEATAAGKVTAVAASAAAVAGGGYVSVDRIVERPAKRQAAVVRSAFSPTVVQQASWTTPKALVQAAKSPASQPASPATTVKRSEFGTSRPRRRATLAPEFGANRRSSPRAQAAAFSAKPPPPPPPPPPAVSQPRPKPAPEFGSGAAAPEFGP
jgi:RNA polymerase sigma factor (sigma-70 family)